MAVAEPKRADNRGAYIRQIMSDMKNGVLALDKNGVVIYSNPQMNSFFEKDDLWDQTVYSLMSENDDPSNDAFWDTIVEVVQGHVIHYQKRMTYTSPSGRKYSFHIISSYLSSEAEGVVITVADETEYETLIRKKHDATIVLIGILLLVCMTVLVTEFHVFIDGRFPHDWIARSTEIAGFLLLAIFLKFTSLTVRDFGIFPENIKRELKEAFIVTGVMVAGMAAAKLILVRSGSTLFAAGRPFFDFSAPPDFYYVKYIAIVFMQELQTKCGLQKSITRVLDIKHKNILAIIVTSIMFMALHVQHGLIYMLGAGVLSAVLAVLYGRHNSLLGCGIVHYAFGISGLVLGWVV